MSDSAKATQPAADLDDLATRAQGVCADKQTTVKDCLDAIDDYADAIEAAEFELQGLSSAGASDPLEKHKETLSGLQSEATRRIAAEIEAEEQPAEAGEEHTMEMIFPKDGDPEQIAQQMAEMMMKGLGGPAKPRPN